jgi:catechol 2,3-dioxygenase-like lactoylglutathione lyase family enzyme
MWGKPPLYIPDSFAVEVRDLQAASSWYKEKLGLRDAPRDIGDDSGRPHVVLQLDKDQYVSLVQVEGQASTKRSYGSVAPIFFAGNLGKTQDWLKNRGVTVEPIESDSGGNQLFRFLDLEGNRLEVCQET